MTQIQTLYSVDDLIKYFKIRNFREQKFRKFQKLQNFYILLTQSFIKQLKKVLLSQTFTNQPKTNEIRKTI